MIRKKIFGTAFVPVLALTALALIVFDRHQRNMSVHASTMSVQAVVSEIAQRLDDESTRVEIELKSLGDFLSLNTSLDAEGIRFLTESVLSKTSLLAGIMIVYSDGNQGDNEVLQAWRQYPGLDRPDSVDVNTFTWSQTDTSALQNGEIEALRQLDSGDDEVWVVSTPATDVASRRTTAWYRVEPSSSTSIGNDQQIVALAAIYNRSSTYATKRAVEQQVKQSSGYDLVSYAIAQRAIMLLHDDLSLNFRNIWSTHDFEPQMRAEALLILDSDKSTSLGQGVVFPWEREEGKPSMAAFQRFIAPGPYDYYLVVEVPESQVLGSSRSTIIQISIAFSFLWLLYLFVAVRLDRLLAPLEAISKSAARIGQGEWNFSFTSLTSQQDEVGAVAVALEQMSEQLKEREIRLERLQERNFARLFDDLPVKAFTYRVSVSGDTEFVGPSAKDVTGIDEYRFAQEMDNSRTASGRTLREFHLQMLVSEQARSATSIELINASGEKLIFSLASSLARDERDKITHIQGVAVDVTGALEGLEQYRNYLDASPDAFLAVDRSGTIVMANAQACTIFGYSPKEFDGLSIDALVPRDLAPRHYKLRDAFFDGDTRQIISALSGVDAIKKDGSAFPADISLSQVDSPLGPLALTVVRDLSDVYEVQIEKKLQTEFLRNLIDQAILIVTVKDKDDRYTLVNNRFLEVFFEDAEESDVLGRTDEELGLSFSVSSDASLQPSVDEGGTVPQLLVTSAQSHEGIKRDFITRSFWTYDKEGKLSGTCFLLTDVTQILLATRAQKEANEALAVERALLSSVLESASVGMWFASVEQEERNVAWTATLREMLGLPADLNPTLLGWVEFVLDEDQDMVREAHQSLLEGTAYDGFCEFRTRRSPDGLTRTIQHSFRILHPENQAPVLTGVMSDVTTLRNEQEMSRQIFDNPAIGVAYVAEGVLVEVNQAYVGMFGFDTKEEVIGQTFLDLSPEFQPNGESSEAMFFKLRAQISKQATNFIWHHTKKDGSVLPAEVTVYEAVLDDQVVIAAIVRDISPLIEAAELAKEASEVKSRFLANMTHEIRTPINAILGLTELLARKLEGKPEAEYTSVIKNSGVTLKQLLDNLLNLSKSDSGKMMITLGPTHLQEEVISILNMFDWMAQKKNLTLRLKPTVGLLPQLMLDKVLIRQILTNLIGNAIKFTEVGEISVSLITTDSHLEEGLLDLQIHVTDTGIGMTSEEIGKVFSDYEQAPAGLKHEEGTGLGLAICERVIAMMNGSISVVSKPGKGSTFMVEIPSVEIYSERRIPMLIEDQEDEMLKQQTPSDSDQPSQTSPSTEDRSISELTESGRAELYGTLFLQRSYVDKLKREQAVSDIELFGETMQELGNEFSYKPLEKWGQSLSLSAQFFDIEKMNSLIDQFEQLLEGLQWEK